LKLAQANSSRDSISKNTITKNRVGGVAQSEGPVFKPQYCNKKKIKIVKDTSASLKTFLRTEPKPSHIQGKVQLKRVSDCLGDAGLMGMGTEQWGTVSFLFYLFFYFLIVLLFICAYNVWVISPPCPHPLPYHPLCPLTFPTTPSIPSRNYFALISNFVVERV
jgi:hypothetical protein